MTRKTTTPASFNRSLFINRIPRISRWNASLVYIFIWFLLPSGLLFGEIYFKDTDHQLEVIRIKGEKPGLTV